MSEPGSSTGGESAHGPDSSHSGWSRSTDWSELRQAGQGGCPAAAEALEALCRRYWNPVYAYVRRCGHEACEAEDITQSFVASFLKPGVLAGLEESRGRFRSLLLVSLKNFLANHWERARAQKRGGGRQHVSLDALAAEERHCAAVPDLSPDALFDRRWALAVIEQALARLQLEEAKHGRLGAFRRLHGFLTDSGATDDKYKAAGADLGLSRAAVGMAVQRLRRRFQEALREEIRSQVPLGQVSEELRSLKAALAGT